MLGIIEQFYRIEKDVRVHRRTQEEEPIANRKVSKKKSKSKLKDDWETKDGFSDSSLPATNIHKNKMASDNANTLFTDT